MRNGPSPKYHVGLQYIVKFGKCNSWKQISWTPTKTYVKLKGISKSLNPQFQGECIDTVAQWTVFGHEQTKVYCIIVRCESKPKKKSVSTVLLSRYKMRSFCIRIPFLKDKFVSLEVEADGGDVSFPLRLYCLDKLHLYVDTTRHELVSFLENLRMPLVGKILRLELEWKKPESVISYRS